MFLMDYVVVMPRVVETLVFSRSVVVLCGVLLVLRASSHNDERCDGMLCEFLHVSIC